METRILRMIVMISLKAIKREARIQLKKQFKNYIYMSLMALILFQTFIFLGFYFFKMPGIILTYLEVYAFVNVNLLVLDGKKISFKDLFIEKERYWKSSITFLLVVFIGYLIVIPFLLFILLINQEPLSILLIVTLLTVEIYFMIRISFTMYLVRDFQYYSLDAVAKSFALTAGNVKRIILFHFSFIGWILLIPFTLGVATLWVLPYIQVSFANLYRTIYREKHKLIAE
jgi:hypothetical protein